MKSLIVDKKRLRQNIDLVKKKAGVPIFGVLKADGYGLGLLQLAEALAQNGIDKFAVTEPNDALQLRTYGFTDQEILVMRSTSIDSELQTILEAGATATVGSYDAAIKLNGIAEKDGAVADAHVKLDTGMGRYGFLPSELDKIINVYTCLENINISGIYTHFHSAFASREATMAQLDALKGVVSALTEQGIETGLVHAANSSALFLYPETILDAVRIGSAFTGRLPIKGNTGLQKVCVLKSRVIEIRWLPKGHSVGYGAGFVTKKPMQIAVVPVGYGDGFGVSKANDIFRFRDCVRYAAGSLRDFLKRRRLYATIGGKRVRVLGHIGLCHTTVDVTGLGVTIGDEVTLDISPLYVNPEIQKIYE